MGRVIQPWLAFFQPSFNHHKNVPLPTRGGALRTPQVTAVATRAAPWIHATARPPACALDGNRKCRHSGVLGAPSCVRLEFKPAGCRGPPSLGRPDARGRLDSKANFFLPEISHV